MKLENLRSFAQYARECGVHPKTINDRIENGALTFVEIGVDNEFGGVTCMIDVEKHPPMLNKKRKAGRKPKTVII